MSQSFNSAMSWNVGRSGTRCAACGLTLEPGKTCWAALVEGPIGGMEGAAPVEGGAAAPDAGAAATPQNAPRPGAGNYERRDFCEACWAQGKRPEAPQVMFSFWKTSVPLPTQKKKLLVDDTVLMDLFTRLEEKTALQDIQFRFVLALILMRKRLLKYERTEPLPEEQAKTLLAPPAPPVAPTETTTETMATTGETPAEVPANTEAGTAEPPAEGSAEAPEAVQAEEAPAETTPAAPSAERPVAAEPAQAAAPTEPPEIWIMTPRGSEEAVQVINPQLTPEQISGVSGQLSQILAEEV